MESGDEVLFEVEGQATEFTEEGLEQTNSQNLGDSESDVSDVENEQMALKNNNATKPRDMDMEPPTPRPGTSSTYGPDEVIVLPRDHVKEQEEEEAGMKQFVNYIRKQGLVIVESSRLAAQTPKFDRSINKGGRQDIQMKSVVNRRPPQAQPGTSNEIDDGNSVVTIYRNAVNVLNDTGDQGNRNLVSGITESKRDSSSSDEPLNTSDESEGIQLDNLRIQGQQQNDLIINNYIAEARAQQVARARARTPEPNRGMERLHVPQPRLRIDMAQQDIRDAERHKVSAYKLQGMPISDQVEQVDKINEINVPWHSALLDEDYLQVGNYVDEITRNKIARGEYVDFAKLMPKDKLTSEDDNHMEMVNKGGMSYWVPMSDRDNINISSYSKWEQAFRVFSNIYNQAFPNRSGELIQYHHTIFTASQTFAWDNVYRYDREFRIHMSRHHTRKWSVILQQAWSMFLKDKISSNNFERGVGQSGQGNGPRCKLCFDFNRGNCTFGKKCKFDHRCSFCNKFGHGSFNCRKANANKGGGWKQTPSTTSNSVELNDKNRWDRYEKERGNANNNNNLHQKGGK